MWVPKDLREWDPMLCSLPGVCSRSLGLPNVHQVLLYPRWPSRVNPHSVTLSRLFFSTTFCTTMSRHPHTPKIALSKTGISSRFSPDPTLQRHFVDLAKLSLSCRSFLAPEHLFQVRQTDTPGGQNLGALQNTFYMWR